MFPGSHLPIIPTNSSLTTFPTHTYVNLVPTLPTHQYTEVQSRALTNYLISGGDALAHSSRLHLNCSTLYLHAALIIVFSGFRVLLLAWCLGDYKSCLFLVFTWYCIDIFVNLFCCIVSMIPFTQLNVKTSKHVKNISAAFLRLLLVFFFP